MVEAVQKNGSDKKICRILLAALLLSFVCSAVLSVQQEAERFFAKTPALSVEAADADEVIGRPDVERGSMPGDTDYITMARLITDAYLMGGKQGSRTLLLRFLPVAWASAFASSVGWRHTIRNHSGRMIALWKSIFYIHRSDGEKGVHPVCGVLVCGRPRCTIRQETFYDKKQ